MSEAEDMIPENIADLYENLEGRKNRSAIFKHYRDRDESHLYPVLGHFNVTTRCIQHLYQFEAECKEQMFGLALCLWIDTEMSKIVNKEF